MTGQTDKPRYDTVKEELENYTTKLSNAECQTVTVTVHRI